MTRWERFKAALVRLGIGGLIVGFLLGIGALAYFAPLFPEWTGFAADPVPSGAAVTPIVVYQPAKTLYDWLQLLLVPLVLAVGGFVLTRTESRYALQLQERREKEAREVEERHSQEAALQAYLDHMTDLLLHEGLNGSKQDAHVRIVARARTLTILSILDKVKKGTVLKFLFEAHLVNYDDEHRIIDLSGADLSKANLTALDLQGVNLQRANLAEADFALSILASSNLQRADLEMTNWWCATLAEANLAEANLSWANMPRINLLKTNMKKAVLTKTNMEGARLQGAMLSMAIMFYTNLTGADLTGADLTDADLTGADLTGADLTDCKVTREQLASAKSIEGAILPFDMPEAATAPPAS